MALLVSVVQVVGIRGVEVDRLLDHLQPEHMGVEVHVALRIGGDRGHVVQPVRTDVVHHRTPFFALSTLAGRARDIQGPGFPIPLPGRASPASGVGTSAYSRPDGLPVNGHAWPP